MTKEHFIEILKNYCNAMILDDSEPLSDWGNGSNYAFTQNAFQAFRLEVYSGRNCVHVQGRQDGCGRWRIIVGKEQRYVF